MHGPDFLHMQAAKKVPSLPPAIRSALKTNLSLPFPVTVCIHLYTCVLPASTDPVEHSIHDWHVCSQEPGTLATESISDKIREKALAKAQELGWGLGQEWRPWNQIDHSASPWGTLVILIMESRFLFLLDLAQSRSPKCTWSHGESVQSKAPSCVPGLSAFWAEASVLAIFSLPPIPSTLHR